MSIMFVNNLLQVVFINFQKRDKRHHLKILSDRLHHLHDIWDLVSILAADDDDGAGVGGPERGRSPEEFTTNIAVARQAQLWVGNLSVKTEIQNHAVLTLENIGASLPDQELFNEFPAQVVFHSIRDKRLQRLQ